MKFVTKTAVALLWTFGLGACVVVDPGSNSPGTHSAPEAHSDSYSGSHSGSGTTESSRMLRDHESDCLTAVADEVGGGEVSTISVEQGENATIVLVDVRGAQAPWRCEHGASEVLRVFYTGKEGGSASSGSASPVRLDDLEGMRAAYFDQELESRGFNNVGGYKDTDTSYTTWWNTETRQCVSVATRDGHVAKIESIVEGNCL